MAHSIIIFPNRVMLFVLCFLTKSLVLIQGQQQVPCTFFMGDSLSDNGNNNLLVTLAKSNYPPYGTDYPGGPTGRFTNGKTVPDFIAELLGFDKPIPAFATAVGSAILKGVNYASAAAGILDETGIAVGDRISLNRQLLNHKATIASLSLLLGPARLKDHLNKCLYAVNMGSNDYLNNYLLPQFYPSSKLYTPDQFSAFLIHQYSQQLKTLYEDGARKVAVFGLGPIGCVPPLLAMYPVNESGCVDFINEYVKLFNDRLKPLVEDLNTNLPAAKFTYINITSISLGIFSLPGITVSNYSCCEVGIALCEPYQVPCSRRNQYIFFDDYHPTQVVNQYTAARIYNALLPSDAYPFDIHQLARQ
ncbi:GDSL esterase/lipase At1g29670-like [Primulina eburnea]|uniref:GDSL esterase/lipase At1g29670-like n=1 Tax=Primulina eburnea TaxID=1245227 RepID=UPI003C6C60B0